MFTLGGDRGADGQDAGMEVGAVAQVGEDVLGLGERRQADPGHALPAHLAEGLRAGAVDPGRHVVAADAGQRAAAFGNAGRGVVRAARAVMGHALDRQPLARQPRLLVASMKPRRCSIRSLVWKRAMRPAMARAIVAGVSSDEAGSSQPPCGSDHSPFSSNLPITRGRTSSLQL